MADKLPDGFRYDRGPFSVLPENLTNYVPLISGDLGEEDGASDPLILWLPTEFTPEQLAKHKQEVLNYLMGIDEETE